MHTLATHLARVARAAPLVGGTLLWGPVERRRGARGAWASLLVRVCIDDEEAAPTNMRTRGCGAHGLLPSCGGHTPTVHFRMWSRHGSLKAAAAASLASEEPAWRRRWLPRLGRRRRHGSGSPRQARRNEPARRRQARRNEPARRRRDAGPGRVGRDDTGGGCIRSWTSSDSEATGQLVRCVRCEGRTAAATGAMQARRLIKMNSMVK
jgi:hypothetical protein